MLRPDLQGVELMPSVGCVDIPQTYLRIVRATQQMTSLVWAPRHAIPFHTVAQQSEVGRAFTPWIRLGWVLAVIKYIHLMCRYGCCTGLLERCDPISHLVPVH